MAKSPKSDLTEAKAIAARMLAMPPDPKKAEKAETVVAKTTKTKPKRSKSRL